MKLLLGWRTHCRTAAIVSVLLVPLSIVGCGSGGTETEGSSASAGEADNPAGRMEALQKNNSVPPQVKQEMLRSLQQQSQQPAGAANKQ